MRRLPKRLEPVKDEMQRLAFADPFLISGAIAYNVVFAFIPLAFAAVAAMSMLTVGDEVIAWIQGVVVQGGPSDIASLLATTISNAEEFVGSSGPFVLIVSLIVALWSGSRAVYAIQKALRLIEGVEERRKYWQSRGIGILLTMGAGVALVLAYVALLFGGWVIDALRAVGIGVGQVTTVSTFAVALWVMMVLFSIYRWGIAVPIRRPFVSAVLVAAMLMVATWLSALVLPTGTAGGATTAAATLGTIGIVLVWSYAVGFIIIVTPSAVSAVEMIIRGPDS